MKYSKVVDWHWGETGDPDAVIMLVDEENNYQICEVYSLRDEEWHDAGNLGIYQGEVLYDTFEEALEAEDVEVIE